MGILNCANQLSGLVDALIWGFVHESCSPNYGNLVHLCIFFHVLAVWDCSETHFFEYIIYLLCFVGQGPIVLGHSIFNVLPVRNQPSLRRKLCLELGVQCYPNFLLAISLYWVIGAVAWGYSCKGWLEASEFFQELVIWGHSLFLHKGNRIFLEKSEYSLVTRGTRNYCSIIL